MSFVVTPDGSIVCRDPQDCINLSPHILLLDKPFYIEGLRPGSVIDLIKMQLIFPKISCSDDDDSKCSFRIADTSL